MTSQTITIPAREVRPGDVLFGMTVIDSKESSVSPALQWIKTAALGLWLEEAAQVTVERPVPSDPIGTVRARIERGTPADVFLKSDGRDGYWHVDGDNRVYTDADVADFPILWKPGMPIPNTEVTA